jgi:hypothetical protein
MCFSPQISLLTATVEFVLAIIILSRFKKSFVTRFAIAFILLLGFYQLTEFMLCTTQNIGLWVRLGFITYTFLPALGLHLVFRMSNRRPKAIVFYIPAIVFAALAALSKGFVSSGVCHSVFISVDLVFLNPSADFILRTIYGAYYTGFIVLSCFFVGIQMKKETDAVKKRKMMVGLSGVLLATVPALLFIFILPSFTTQFPSLYCEFALLVAIAAYWVSYIDNKERTNK